MKVILSLMYLKLFVNIYIYISLKKQNYQKAISNETNFLECEFYFFNNKVFCCDLNVK